MSQAGDAWDQALASYEKVVAMLPELTLDQLTRYAQHLQQRVHECPGPEDIDPSVAKHTLTVVEACSHHHDQIIHELQRRQDIVHKKMADGQEKSRKVKKYVQATDAFARYHDSHQ